MSALPIEFHDQPIPRTYNGISAVLPPEMREAFTSEFHAADLFNVSRVLEKWGRNAEALLDPATAAALARCRPTEEGITLDAALAAAEL
ncbi:hypothetical protein ABZW10_33075 [Kitasatospora sp. NPDC004723]|uniref:hypothetical protein n=1 Tax=Kitasatospora sp. NPDC004723 TaxID=3154288 RepID=UPI0033AFF58C